MFQTKKMVFINLKICLINNYKLNLINNYIEKFGIRNSIELIKSYCEEHTAKDNVSENELIRQKSIERGTIKR